MERESTDEAGSPRRTSSVPTAVPALFRKSATSAGTAEGSSGTAAAASAASARATSRCASDGRVTSCCTSGMRARTVVLDLLPLRGGAAPRRRRKMVGSVGAATETEVAGRSMALSTT